jgi:SSS family solute:Na+ symporter
MMGWPSSMTPYVAIAIGLLTVVYTSMGGIRAVVFTDVVQSFILLGGAILSILLITTKMGGVGAWWPTEWSPAWDEQPFFSLDPTVRVTWVGSVVFMTVWWICTAGSDQMAIQRYLATRDAAAARRAFLTTGLANVLVTLVLAALGFALLGFFRANPQYLTGGLSIQGDADKLFPYYIVRFLPAGITGLVISGLLAAAMSSLSSGINSSCSVICVDFIDRFARTGQPGGDRMRQTKIVAVMSGLVAVVLSSLMGGVTGNIMEVTVRTNHVFVAPLFGLFFMALFVPFATPFGTLWGALAGCLAAVVVAYWDLITSGPALSFQWISTISLIVNLLVAIPLSLISGPGRQRSDTTT